MAEVNLSLPDRLIEWAAQRVADGDYSSMTDYVCDLIRRDREVQARNLWLRAEVEKGLASGTSRRDLTAIYEGNRARREAA